MVCFDKLKIITDIEYISNINFELFKSKRDHNLEVLNYKFEIKSPYLLLMKIDNERKQLVIEFTSKILNENFINLINRNNIHQCFENINKLKICNLDVNSIINNAEVYKCDVTKCIIYDCTKIRELEYYTKNNIINHNKWNCIHKPRGFILSNNLSTPSRMKRIAVYNKKRELSLAKHKSFINSLSNKDEIMSYFENKIQIEYNIKTKSQIRTMLNIDSNKLIDVLNSEASPISEVFKEAIKTHEFTPTNHVSNLSEYKNELVLKECGYNLDLVETKVRSLISKNTSVTKMMKPFKELYNKLKNSKKNDGLNIIELLKQ